MVCCLFFCSTTCTAFARLLALVVAGNCKSLRLARTLSSLCFLPTSLSEQTAKLINGVSVSWFHSRKVWLNNDKLGTRKSTRLPFPAIFSAIFSAVNVLPVPQAIISLPRVSPSLNRLSTFFKAFCWCGRKPFLAFNTGVSLMWNCDQSIWLFSKSSRLMTDIGICWLVKASLAFFDHLFVVVTI